MIKIKINKDGYLEINRRGKMVIQRCYPGGDSAIGCCHACPAFEEPIIDDVITLQICMTSLRCLGAEFQDDRR